MDVAPILRGEFTRSTGEADRRKAQAMLPMIAAEYEARVREARDRLADNRFRDLSAAEIKRLAADFYRDALPAYRITRAPKASSGSPDAAREVHIQLTSCSHRAAR